MAAVVKIAAVAVVAALLMLTIKKSNGEMTVVLGLAVCAYAVFAVVNMAGQMLDILKSAKIMSGLPDTVFLPVFKCIGIGIIARIAADLCKDSGQTAMAGAVETASSVCAVYVALPLLTSLLQMLGELL